MKTHKVRPVLIESKEKTNLLINTLNNRLLFGVQNIIKEHAKYYELILISLENDKIEVGDLFTHKERFLDGTVKTKQEYNNAKWILKECEKGDSPAIERALYGKNAKNSLLAIFKVIARQSQIPPEYISKFIEQYNNGCVEDFEINMMYKECPNSSIENWNYFPEPLLTNGFVSIVEKEPITYTEEEVNKLLHKFLDIQEGLNTYQRHASLDVWFEQNKKK